MKKTYLILLTVLTIATIAIVACSKLGAENKNELIEPDVTIETRTTGVTYTVIDTPYSLNLSITFYDDGTNSLNSTEKTTIGTYLDDRFSSYNFSNVSRTDAVFGYDANNTPKEEITLYGHGEDSQGEVTPIAFVFNGDGDGTGGTLEFGGSGSGVEHSCVGAPCHCCDFIYRSWNGGIFGETKMSEIIGCKCTTTPAACFITNGSCNHTKTSKS